MKVLKIKVPVGHYKALQKIVEIARKALEENIETYVNEEKANGERIHWKALLQEVSKTHPRFRSRDVKKLLGLDNTEMYKVYAAVHRFHKEGLIKRNEDGTYSLVEKNETGIGS